MTLSSSISYLFFKLPSVFLIKVVICFYLFNCNVNGGPLGTELLLKGYPPETKRNENEMKKLNEMERGRW